MLVFLIYSCKKELNNAAADTINDATVSQAKAWYMQTYSQTNLSKNVKRTLDLNTGTADSTFNYTEFTGPDWNHAANYTRFNADVLELPADPGRSVIETSLGSFPGSQPIYKNKYSRSSFLLLKDSTGYHGYVMTIIADSAYINNDLSKLDKNKYNNRDANFSGVLIYNTPDGLPVSGWIYKNGEIIKQMQLSNNKGRDASTTNARILLNNNISRLAYHSSKLLEVYEYCQPFYVTVTTKDNNGNVVSSVTTTQGQVCNYEFVDVPTGGTGGNSAPATTGGGGAASPATSPCTVPAANTQVAVSSPNHKTTLVVQYVEGSGFPAPTSTTSAPCNTLTPTPANGSIDPIILFCGGLTNAEQVSINNTINAFKTEDCPSKFLYGYFSNHTFSFCIKSGNYNVIFNPVNNSFTFSTAAAATPTFASLLEHEFFHAFQNASYPGGISAYGQSSVTGLNSPGFVNIEFEQEVFNDISRGNYNAFSKGTLAQQNAYKNWINGITSNGTSYPKLILGTTAYTQFISSYNNFLTQYNALSGNPNSSTIINLDPKALVTLFNNTNPNC